MKYRRFVLRTKGRANLFMEVLAWKEFGYKHENGKD
jgi:hypothetical protein